MAFTYMNDVTENLSLPQLTNDIIRGAYADPVLARPEICPIEYVNRLHIRQPSLGTLKVNMGLRELESTGVQTPSATHRDVELLFDGIAIQVSQESQIENYYGDSLQMIAEDRGQALAKAQEIWIAAAMRGHAEKRGTPEQDDPLRLFAHVDYPAHPVLPDDYRDNLVKCAHLWHHHVVPHAIQMLGVYKPTAVCMHPFLWAELQPLFNGSSVPQGNIPYAWATNKIPGFDCPVVTSQYLDVDKIYVVSAKANAMRGYVYDEMSPILHDEPKIRSTVMYTGIYRTVASGFRMVTRELYNGAGQRSGLQQVGNAGIIEITLSGGFFGIDIDYETETPFDDQIYDLNQSIYNEINDFAGKYILMQDKAGTPDDAIAGMKQAFSVSKPEKAN